MSRIALLVACVLVGWVVGAVGSQVTGSPWWYLAIPVCVAAAWLFVADPEQCDPKKR